MEVGAVKQAFNNELILLKKKLNQAKVQVINKLTRKAKTLVEKKAPEPLKEKLKRKAESAIKEVMIMKKIKARDIGKFIVTHTGKLQDYLNKAEVDHNKACARLLLHKALQDKYKFIRSRFTDVPIKDLFMSRQERLKLKKEAREKQKEKKKKKANKAKAKGDWDVEDIEMGDKIEGLSDKSELSDDENKLSANENELSGIDNDMSDDEMELSGAGKTSDDEGIEHSNSSNDSDQISTSVSCKSKARKESDHHTESEEHSADENEAETNVGKFVKLNPKTEPPISPNNKLSASKTIESKFKAIEKEIKKKQETKQKDTKKNKNINEKILQRNFKKKSNEAPIQENKVVDPFFITSTGENYLSVAEPRQPDEVKEVHKQGNRKLRRAVMFGHVAKTKPRQEFRPENNKFSRTDKRFEQDNRYEKQNGFKKDRFSDKDDYNDRKTHFKDRHADLRRRNLEESKPEKLHPSWEAKKRQSGIVPFKGKKIVFDES